MVVIRHQSLTAKLESSWRMGVSNSSHKVTLQHALHVQRAKDAPCKEHYKKSPLDNYKGPGEDLHVPLLMDVARHGQVSI